MHKANGFGKGVAALSCWLAAFVCLPALIADGAAYKGSQYTYFTGPGDAYTEPTGINSKLMIAGYYEVQGGAHGFLRDQDGTITTFDPQGSVLTWAFGINNGGDIVGEYSESVQNVVMHGFVRDSKGTITSFDPSGSTNTSVAAIDSRGQVAGYFDDQFGEHGFLRAEDGTFTIFDPPKSVATASSCINSAGVIAGNFQDAEGLQHGFVRAVDGTIKTFDPSGSVETFVTSINKAGTITGYFSETGDSDPTYHGFFRSARGAITVFDPPKQPEETYPMSINDRGLIAGYYYCNGRYGCRYATGFIRTLDGKFKTFRQPPGIYVSGLNSRGFTTGNVSGEGFLRNR